KLAQSAEQIANATRTIAWSLPISGYTDMVYAAMKKAVDARKTVQDVAKREIEAQQLIDALHAMMASTASEGVVHSNVSGLGSTVDLEQAEATGGVADKEVAAVIEDPGFHGGSIDEEDVKAHRHDDQPPSPREAAAEDLQSSDSAPLKTTPDTVLPNRVAALAALE
ncbi:hypothetical protein C0991_004617, partial [Blastosporella zonata]